MSKNVIAVVQVACGFARQPQNVRDLLALSIVDFARSQTALKVYHAFSKQEALKVLVWTTGQVAWGPALEMPELTLASLNAARLKAAVPAAEIMQVPGLNAFSESYNATKMAQMHNVKKLYVVTSGFYLLAYQRMWEAAAKRNGVAIQLIAVNHPEGVVGPAVFDFYKSFQPQTLSRVAASSKIGHLLAKFVADKKTVVRATSGFRIDGHSNIQ